MYLPWIPYLAKLIHSDVFVIFDTVQYPGGRSFTNRNYVYQKFNPIMLTLPLEKHSLHSNFSEININKQSNWNEKHAKTIKNAYSRSTETSFLEELLLLYDEKNICCSFTEYCINHLEFIKRRMGLNTTIIRASELNQKCDGLNRIISILRELKATSYITGRGQGSLRYMDTENFYKEDIEIKVIEKCDRIFKYKKNEVRKGAFLDLMFYEGENTLNHILKNSKLVSF